MWINWLVLAPTQYGFSVPTYENYGGPGYSDAHLLRPGETPSFSVTPGDDLDALFREHDRVCYNSTDPTVLAQADLKLIQGIVALQDSELSGEGHLYAGGAILALMANIVVTHNRPDLLTPDQVALYTADAVDNLQQASVQPESSEILALVRWIDQVVSRLDAVGPLASLIPVLAQAGFFDPVGTAGNDILLGRDGNDTVTGLAGNDFVHGFAGNDLLLGGSGSDILAGGRAPIGCSGKTATMCSSAAAGATPPTAASEGIPSIPLPATTCSSDAMAMTGSTAGPATTVLTGAPATI